MYPEALTLRNLVTESQHEMSGSDFTLNARVDEFSVIIFAEFNVPSPQNGTVQDWDTFLRFLTPLIRIGDLKQARKLVDDMKKNQS